jgi:ABC-type sugar transport system permease subunit
MATSSTVGLPLPGSSKTLDLRSGRIQRFLLRDRTLGYLFLLPALLVILSLVAYPFASAIVLTFQHKMAGTAGRFIGLANYRELLHNEVFLRTILNTVTYTVVAVAIKFLVGMSMALVLNQERLQQCVSLLPAPSLGHSNGHLGAQLALDLR